MNETIFDRAYGCLLGVAIGDALGMPASFMSPLKIKNVYGRIDDFLQPASEQVQHGSLAGGTFTDDTQESMIIASVLIEAGAFDEKLFLTKMKEWAIKTDILNSTVIGPSTRRFLTAILNDGDVYDAGKTGDTNGGAMRAAPIGVFYAGREEAAMHSALAFTRPSHGSKAGLASACAIAAAVAACVGGQRDTALVMDAAIRAAEYGEEKGFDIPSPSVAERINLVKEVVEQYRGRELTWLAEKLYRLIGAGMKSYESIPLSLGIFYAANGDFEKGLLTAVNIGDDADTNGSIVGGLCGAYSGSMAVRPAWKERIENQNDVDFDKMARDLLAVSQALAK
ncbi:MAG: ADP-ribosylglycohydrolase family protein [Anaerolineae bacterium]|nr:ADP-ribosylglycohydrolase family protein [Anaerolineae bacterium]